MLCCLFAPNSFPFENKVLRNMLYKVLKLDFGICHRSRRRSKGYEVSMLSVGI